MSRENWIRIALGAAMAAVGYILRELGIPIPPLDVISQAVRGLVS